MDGNLHPTSETKDVTVKYYAVVIGIDSSHNG